MVFIEAPTSRAAWKTDAGAAETSAGSIALRRASDTLRRQPEQSDPPEGDQPPISTLGRPTTPLGAPEQPMPKSYSSSPSCIPVQYPREDVISSRFMRLADRCFGPCGTATRRLPGTPVGDTPICVSFRGWGRNRKKWTERPGHSAAVTSSRFEYLGIPSSSTWQRT